MRKIIFACILILTSGCNKSISKYETLIFTRDDFKRKIILKADTVLLPDLQYPRSCLVIKDTLLLIQNLSNSEHFIEIYSLNSRKLLCITGKTGRGPGEFLSADIYYNNNEYCFYVFDVVARTWNVFNIDTLLAKRDLYIPERYSLPDFIKTVAELDYLHFIGYNIWYTDNEKFFNPTDEIIKWNKKNKPDLSYNKTRKFYEVVNETGGYLIVSPENDRIAVPYFYSDKIKLYDKSLNLIKVLNGPDRLEPELEETGTKEAGFKDGKYYRAYYPFYYTDDSFYIIYLGINGIKTREINFRKPVEVFRISWDGELLDLYKLDNYIINLSMDSKRKFLYGTHIEKYGDIPVLLKYRIE